MIQKPRFRPVIVLALIGSLGLSACVPLLVGGVAATTGLVVSDRRTSGMQLTDKTISIKAEAELGSQFADTNTRINANSFNRRVLLTGEVASQADKDRATTITRGIADVSNVLNELMIAPPASFSVRSKDTWISSKVKSELLITKNVPSGSILVTTSQGVVYLMGQVSQTEGNNAAQVASTISGVVRVVKAFDIVSGSQAANTSNTASTNNMTSPSSATTNSSPTADSSTQTFPLQ